MLKVLIVEDVELIRKNLIHMLDWAKLDCVVAGEASNGEQGVVLIRRIRPDIVMTDITMPVLDGIAMLSETIKEVGYEAILFSGHENFSDAKRAIELGVSEYLLKPLNIDEVSAALCKAVFKVRKKRKLQQLEFGSIKDRRRILDIEAIENAIPISASYARITVNFIKENYRNKISLNDLSRKLMINANCLNRMLNQATGYTFTEFLTRYRVQQAVRLLLTTDKRIYYIAEEIGFAEYKYFRIVFKRYVGYTPMEFVEKTVESTLYL